MFAKPPKSRTNQYSKEKRIKNNEEEDENKENITLVSKQIKVNISKKELEREDITSMVKNDLANAMSMFKRHSFTKDPMRGNIYIKKNPSASLINRNIREPLSTVGNIINSSSYGNIKGQVAKESSASIERKTIVKGITQKTITIRKSVGNNPAHLANYDKSKNSSLSKRNSISGGYGISHNKDILLHNSNKEVIQFEIEESEQIIKPKPNHEKIGITSLPKVISNQIIYSPINSKAVSLGKEINKLHIAPEVFKLQEEDNDRIFFNDLPIGNPQIPTQYINTIYHNLLLEELALNSTYKAIASYMQNQKEINEQMRSILIDWIIDVHLKFNFTEETLYMTVNILDRYLSYNNITRNKLQLLGITALMIACKHEEIDLPKVKDFIYITDNTYSREDVFQMENEVLSKLNFNLLTPSPLKFFEILATGFHFTHQQLLLGKYLMESFLIEIKMIKYKASIIACACAYIVMKFYKISNYSDSYDKKYYTLNNNEIVPYSVKECAKDVCLFVDNINKTNYASTHKKYSKSEYEKVAMLIIGK